VADDEEGKKQREEREGDCLQMEEQYIISQRILDDFISTNPSSCDVPTLNSLLSYVINKGLVAGGRGEEVAIDLVKSFDAMAIGPADDAPPLPVPHSSSTSFPNSPPLKTFNLPSNTIPALPSPRLMKGKTISSPMRAKMTNRVTVDFFSLPLSHSPALH
jgi:hypothetical protein